MDNITMVEQATYNYVFTRSALSDPNFRRLENIMGVAFTLFIERNSLRWGEMTPTSLD